jgi:hypothetical protein
MKSDPTLLEAIQDHRQNAEEATRPIDKIKTAIAGLIREEGQNIIGRQGTEDGISVEEINALKAAVDSVEKIKSTLTDTKALEDFCTRFVETMGRLSEDQLIQAAAAKVLQTNILLINTNRPHQEMRASLFEGSEDRSDIDHLLLKPGHYDFLIPAAPAARGRARRK